MSQFMLAVYASDEPREPMTQEEMQQGFAIVHAIEEEMRAANALVWASKVTDAIDAPIEVRPFLDVPAR